jgi:hypothetical protein
MKNINPLGMLDEHFLPEKLRKLKDPLVKLEAHIDWMTISVKLYNRFEAKCTTAQQLNGEQATNLNSATFCLPVGGHFTIEFILFIIGR